MKRLIAMMLICFCVCALDLARAQQEEKLTITTYYPSPTGVYNHLQSNRLTVGDFNNDSLINSNDLPDQDGELVVTKSLYLRVSGSTAAPGVKGGEGLRIRSDDNYFGPGVDAVIIEQTEDDQSVNGAMILGFATSAGNNINYSQPGWAVNSAPVITLRGTGNVGIGTTAPDSSLVVAGNASLVASINSIQMGIENEGHAAIELAGASTNGSYIDFTTPGTSYKGRIWYDNPSNRFEFWTNASAMPKMAIDTDGNVGIGISTPNSPLHIKNNVASGAIDDFSEYQILLWNTTTAASSYGLGISSSTLWLNSYDRFQFRRQGSETAALTINATGVIAPREITGSALNDTAGIYGQFRAINGNYGIMLRNDGSNTYFLLTDSGNQYGQWNALRPFYINDATGNVYVGTNLAVAGSLSKGSGGFEIPHPDSRKDKARYVLRHSFVESPTRGDNLYRFQVTIEKEGSKEIELPDYFKYLNENPQVWVSPVEHFGRGCGSVNVSLSRAKITVDKAGLYNILIIGTRKDKVAREFFDKQGVEFIKDTNDTSGRIR